jgi:molybdate transport system permease protein
MIDWQPVYLSLKVAVISLLFVFVLGMATAFFIVRRHFSGKAALEAFITLPLVLPPVVTGFILLLLVGKHGPIGRFLATYFDAQIIFTPAAAVLAAIVVAFPLMYQSAKAAFLSIDTHFEDVARTLGASEIRVFLTVTLPLAMPGLIAGAVLSFARALGEFGATIMIAGNIPGKTQTIPLAIYFAAESNDLQEAGIYVAIISIITFSAIFWLNAWTRSKSDRNPQRR